MFSTGTGSRLTALRTPPSSDRIKKITRPRNGANADLRDYFFYQLSGFSSYHLVYIGQSSYNQRSGLRHAGWSPNGVMPVRTCRSQQEKRYDILAAYAQDGAILSRVCQRSADGNIFQDFLEQLLHHCGRWPEPKSVLIMDNVPFHRAKRVKVLCSQKGVKLLKLLYLPPYSPDLNAVKGFFAELKGFVKELRGYHASTEFRDFLTWCADEVGARTQSANVHFRQSGVEIEEL